MMSSDDIADVLAIGRRNQEIIRLAKAWCRNVRRDRGPLGVGIPEQMTGLPVSGGSLACDYAEPATMFGMQLEASAIDFYRRNCVGCKYHAPTAHVPNLKTWAEQAIQRSEREAELARIAAKDREEARMRRAADRRK